MMHASVPQQDILAADVVIVGGGFVGGALACALGDQGLRAVVIEAAEPSALTEQGFDGRASAISLTSRRLLERLGIWDEVADAACPMLDIRVADADSRLFLHYDHREVGDEPFGHMLENRLLRRATQQRLLRHPTAMLIAPASLVALTRGSDGVEARLAGGGRVRAPLAVAADGRDSPTREQAGIRTTGWNYGQTAIVCTVAHAEPHRFVAVEHFLPAGPFAILPLNGNRSSIVWTERTRLAPTIMALDEAAFTRELARRFGDFLGALRVVGPRWSYPLSLQYAARATAPRLALVGDALHAMHPIAGQGLNMGYRDVAALTDVLATAAADGRDLGSEAVLARYARWRRFDNLQMLLATDGLNRLFSNDIPPIRMARDVGLAIVNRLPPVKRVLMRHAMGMIGDLPPLMRA
ncbi:MAG: UbiH/UbiF/VisC/COQ6 family ubiquinone biosynthesis hydroxylase [Rhodospirillales bacterium]|nr:UbiH/UbiF/VisC/COQ6 family ubiquinone biosynthesis hydroxylase [Rhodospirillales bacterium]